MLTPVAGDALRDQQASWPLAGDAGKRVRELPAGVPRVRVTAVTMKCGLSRPPR